MMTSMGSLPKMDKTAKSAKRKSARSRVSTASRRLDSDDPDDSDDSEDSFSSSSTDLSYIPSRRVFTSDMCNLTLPVPRVKTMLKIHNYAGRVSTKGAVYLTAILEYVTTEILELSLNAARSDNAIRIQPKHVNEAIKTDPEFFRNFRDVTVVKGGMVPYYSMYNSLNDDNAVSQSAKKSRTVKKPRTTRRRG